MVVSRKRGRQEEHVSEALPVAPKAPGLLDSIRNMWEFANLSQWIFIFGKSVKIDENLDIEDLEMECLKTQSTVLSDIGLALLKFVSSHRGLTPEIFDEYTRRQYLAKAPQKNPFGDEEEPAKFIDFDVFTKIRVLQQLTQWTFGNPDRIRERMEEQKDAEQTYWRIEPFGWDVEDRTYIVLDDNRLYRQTNPPPPKPPKATPKKSSKKAKAAVRASKRRKTTDVTASDDEGHEEVEEEELKVESNADNGLGGAKWECIAITLAEFNDFLGSIRKSRDPNEKMLHARILDELLPLLEKQEESRKRKQEKKDRELLALEKLATAKRSSRIAGKQEQQKLEEEALEAERKKQADMIMAKREQERWAKLEKERESRMQTREQRIKEREARRILHEAELANLSEDAKKLETGEARVSERHLKAEMERKKAALEELTEDENWEFDCICGAHGQVDDGTHSIACEKCNVWQHTKCVGISEDDANRDDFIFVCKTCIKRERDAEAARIQKIKDEEDAKRRKVKEEERRARESEEAKNRPPSGIKIKFSRPGSSSSSAPPTPQQNGFPQLGQANGQYGQYGGSSMQLSPQRSPSILQHSPQKPAYSPPYTNGNQGYGQPNMAPFAHGAQSHTYRPSASPTAPGFALPQAYSPTSLPPPQGARNYSTVTQTHSTSPPATQAQPYQSPAAAYYSQGIHATPNSRPSGYPPRFNHQRKVSTGFPSPETGAPVLKPSTNPQSPSPPIGLFSGPGSRISSSPLQSFSTPAPAFKDSREVSRSGHLSALPPPNTGMSPIKHSPPRATTSNGFIAATPHALPPVASLSPSPSQQNPTPPIKQSTAPSLPAIASPSLTILHTTSDSSLIKPASLPPPSVPQLPMSSPIKPASPTPLSAVPPPPHLNFESPVIKAPSVPHGTQSFAK